ncbi:MAG TPA: hypothetical protein VG165_14605 [Solirubrobacteraceae bacterium]|jgi:hypothetical protein|nr:hypothetical protein [Solirubrobacteraceae bacterium]
MPDETGNQTAEVQETPLHAYGDGREEDVQEGSRGVTGDQGQAAGDSYQDGGHPGDTEHGDTPMATGDQDAAGADTGSGAGVADPGQNDNDAPASDDPESPARADASRPPRGAPIA